MNNGVLRQKLSNVADIKLSNVDKKVKTGERSILLCNYVDVYKNSYIDLEKSKEFMIASCTESEYKKFLLKEGQVAITKDSEKTDDIGIPAYISENFEDVVLGYHLSLITPKKGKLDGKYLNYWLKTKQLKKYFENNAGGSGQRCTLILDCIKSIPLMDLDIKVQESISKVLYDIDVKIELNKKIKKELEELARIIYDYWFIQFDFPNKNGKPYKSSGGEMIYSKRLKREIPKGWGVGLLGDILKIQKGISYKSSEIKNEDGSPMINLNSFNLDGTYKEEGIKHFTGKIPALKTAQFNDLLIASTDVTRNADIIGKAILVPNYYPKKITYSMDISKVIPNEENLKSYLMMLFNSKHYHDYIKWFASGTLVLHLNDDGIKWYPFEKPTKEILDKWNKIYNPIFKKICETQKQNKELVKLRDFLLPLLMNQQVTIAA